MKTPLRAVLGAVALVALAGAARAQKPAAPPTAALFNRAIVAMQAGRLGDAERLYRQVVQAEPGNAGAWANLGLVLARQRRVPEAVATLRKAYTLAPQQHDFLAQAAALEWQAGQADAALADARKVRQREPRNPTALAVEAGILTARKAYAEALPALRALNTVRGGRDTATLQSLTFALAVTGRTSEALAAVRRLCALAPRDPAAHLMHGDLAGQAGYDARDRKLLAEARAAYQRAYALSPKNLRAGINASLAAEMAGDAAEARQILTAVVAAHPDEAQAHYALGRLQLANAQLTEAVRLDQARHSFETAVALAPRNPEYTTALGYVLLLQSNPEYDRAANYFRAALSVAPTHERARRGLVDALWKGNRRVEAIAAQRALAAQLPADLEVGRRLASMLRTSGKPDESYAALRALAARRPKDPAPLLELADQLLADGKNGEAAEALGDASKRAPGDAAVQTRLGEALEKSGHAAEARARFDAAIAADPRHEPAYAALAGMLERAKQGADAVAVRERWLKALPNSNRARWELAQAYADAGRDADALQLMARITLRRDDPMRMTYRLGPVELLEKRGRHDEAVSELRRLLAEEPSEPLRLRLAEVLAVQGKFDEARDTLRPLLQSAKSSAAARLTLASLYERGGKLDDAAREFEDLIQREPQVEAATTGLWRVRAAQGNPDAATEFVIRIALSEPEEPNAALVGALDQRWQLTAAPAKYLEFTARALKAYPRSRRAVALRAAALVRETPDAAARTEAVRLYSQLAELAPTDPDPPLQQGRQLEALARKADAIAAYTESARRQRGGAADAALKRLGAPLPPEKPAPAPPKKP